MNGKRKARPTEDDVRRAMWRLAVGYPQLRSMAERGSRLTGDELRTQALMFLRQHLNRPSPQAQDDIATLQAYCGR